MNITESTKTQTTTDTTTKGRRTKPTIGAIRPYWAIATKHVNGPMISSGLMYGPLRPCIGTNPSNSKMIK